ncbi:MAG TPA: DUF1499 domain-containing protein [Gammaproteobacteria bacterium]|nr:DUF1499 domain-containing protein [Gammaproteobacteria bacterium]
MSVATASLPPCPDSPNCVSSQATNKDQQVDPIVFTLPPQQALARLKQVLAGMPRTRLVKEEGGYLHAEVRSFLFRFVDDLEFLVDNERNLIHIRSASRTGHSDFGVNRRRVERIRKAFDGPE